MPFTPDAPSRPGATCTQWATAEDVCAPCGPDDDIDGELLDRWLEVASSILYGLTGSRWPGLCTEVIYPEPTECLAWMGRRWSGLRMRHTRPRELRLPGYPAVEVERVMIDGVELDPARYRIDDQRWLVYVPESASTGRRGWPDRNDPRLPDGQVGTWSVEYIYGAMPPPGGREAAGELGCQLALSCTPDADCRLPERVTSITRQGVTMAVLDPLTLFDDGKTGLPNVDLWVASTRLANSRRPAALMVPGRRAAVRRRGA